MPKKITNFEIRDAENGRVIREGDNAMLKKDGVYSVANDDGDWKPFYVVDLDADDEQPEPGPEDQTPDPDEEPETGEGEEGGEGSEPDPEAEPGEGEEPGGEEGEDPTEEPEGNEGGEAGEGSEEPSEEEEPGDGGEGSEEPTDPNPDPDPTPDPDPGPTPPPPNPTPTPGANIQNKAELAAAVGTPGTYYLAPGNYGILPRPVSGVSLIAADPTNKPVFNMLHVISRNDITLDGLHLKYDYVAGHQDAANVFSVRQCHRVTIRNCLFEGDVQPNGPAKGRALIAEGAPGLILEDNEFRMWWTGPTVIWTLNASIKGNNIHTIRSDGMKLAQVDDSAVEENYIHDFGGAAGVGSNDHRDAIQIQRSTPVGCKRLIIRNNFVDQNGGEYMQGIWSGTDGGDGKPDIENDSLEVRDNILISAHKHGISLYATNNSTIDGNTLVQVPRLVPSKNPKTEIPGILIAGSGNAVTNNTAPIQEVGGASASGNIVAVLDAATVRAAARTDARWSHHFGG